MSLKDLEHFIDESTASVTDFSGTTRRERYQGVMLGVAAGNSLGLPVEGWTYKRIAARFSNGLTEIDVTEKERPWDDDLAQTAILAEALLDKGDLDLEDLAFRFIRWANENGRGIGNLTSFVISELASSTPANKAARLVWERYDPRPAGNGALMRCAPVALRWRRDGHRLVQESMKSALITHYDPRCVWSIVVLNTIIALDLSGIMPDLKQLALVLDNAGAPPVVGASIRNAIECTLDDLVLDGADMGYTLKAMQVGLWALQQKSDFETVLVKVVKAGGDTDTNGAVAGAVMGARVGAARIPQRWLENIRDTDRLVILADQLFQASEGI